jgi:pyruvate kinase
MLSAETANGKYPQLAVETMMRILIQAERLVNWEQEFIERRSETLGNEHIMSVMEAICSSAVETANELKSRLLLVCSDSGRMGLLIAKYRPRSRVLVVTESDIVANQMSVSRGVEGMVVPSIRNLETVWEWVVDFLKRNPTKFHLPSGHPVVLVDSPPASYDTRFELSKRANQGMARWNMVQVMRVPSLD